jgi:anaerobic ribonucleoside-triphosphate reductase activating protein
MLRFLYVKEIFREIPGETILGISLTGCKIHCKGCHSRELWEDKGTILSPYEFSAILDSHPSVSCVLLFGGEHEIGSLKELFKIAHGRFKTAWYAGLDFIPKEHLDIIQCLDYLKLGHYDTELGGLDSPTTNQRLYKIEHQGDGNYNQIDITHLLWKK